MAFEIQKQRIELPSRVPGPGITPHLMTEKVKFKHAIDNNANLWIVALNGFHLEYSNGDDLSVLKHEVNVHDVALDPADSSNRTLKVQISFLLADDNGTAAFNGWADVNILAQI